MKSFLVQKRSDSGVNGGIYTEAQLISYISMSDCSDEEYRLFDISVFGEVREIFYKGWQPGCLIELADGSGKTVVHGYGIEH